MFHRKFWVKHTPNAGLSSEQIGKMFTIKAEDLGTVPSINLSGKSIGTSGNDWAHPDIPPLEFPKIITATSSSSLKSKP